MNCSNCGFETSNTNFCRNCGVKIATTNSVPPSSAKSSITKLGNISVNTIDKPAPSKMLLLLRSNWILFSGSALVLVILVLLLGNATGVKWEKIDVPEHEMTYHSETELTGKNDVVDNHIPPCFVGEDWVECVNIHVAEFNATCASASLTPAAHTVCDNYSAMIEGMKAKSRNGTYVSTLGTWGSLSLVPETKTISVSNDDYIAAITHIATCYFGFIGECEQE